MTDAAEIAAKAAPIGHGKLQWRILMGFVLGLAGGLLAYTFARDAEWVATVVTYVTGPIGQIFLRLLFMLVIPLLFSALVVGIAEMGEVRALKKIGIRTLVYTIVVSGIAVALSVALVNLFQPGAGVDREAANELLAQGAEGAAGIVERSGEGVGEQSRSEAEHEAHQDAPLQPAVADRRGLCGHFCGVGHPLGPLMSSS